MARRPQPLTRAQLISRIRDWAAVIGRAASLWSDDIPGVERFPLLGVFHDMEDILERESTPQD